MPKSKDWDKKQRQLLIKQILDVEAAYEEAAAEAIALGASMSGAGAKATFSFSDHPRLKMRVDKVLNTFARNLQVIVVSGISAAWAISNNKNDDLVKQVFGRKADSLTGALKERYFNNNDKALASFISRKEKGLGLSDRVWNYTSQFKKEIEMVLGAGIGSGLSADQMAKQLKQYLKNPDALFRRVRNDKGELVLSKPARAYHPGQGVYRSSYKNARRLAATECNMAYRHADHERWQQLDFVVGMRIKVSATNHVSDMCDDLAGDYPKDFLWDGWHPHCRCHVLSICKTPEEMERDEERMIQGLEPLQDSVNTVTDVPEGYKDWLRDNADRATNSWASKPRFMENNPLHTNKYVKEGLQGYMDWNELKPVTPHKKGTTNVATFAEVRSVIMDFAKANPKLFNGTLKDVIEVPSTNGMMGIERLGKRSKDGRYDGVVIKINAGTCAVEIDGRGVAYNASREIREAIKAIRLGKAFTFEQEYALESMWHEIKHAGGRGWKSEGSRKTTHLRMAMETVNQFCARRTYNRFVKALGGECRHRTRVINEGLGYTDNVRNLGVVLDRLKLNKQSFARHFNRVIMKSDYEDIEPKLISYIRTRAKLTVESATKIVNSLHADYREFEKEDFLSRMIQRAQ